ncbi:ribonuclease HII [Mesorhizobium koreense]|uniref:ribonuclease HII n=1 Tax=Mesorhizobium koreense TaxID=3074855 RepID=UPI00287B9ACE|nr:ribonuclease HII [Mesorhizobium sp. WR6]
MARSRSDSPLLFELPLAPDFSMEKRAIRSGMWPVAGLDEAGRGPLAGPVAAAAVILDPKAIPAGLDDSKRLTAAEREALFGDILASALAVSVASVSAGGIDQRNILRASLEAMRRALTGLCVSPRMALADGRDVPPGLPCPAEAVVKGDQRSQSIAAASIVAKVTRDRMMAQAGRVHTKFGFGVHMGYATARHRAEIADNGPLPRLHRTTFAPFRLATVEIEVEEELVLAQE